MAPNVQMMIKEDLGSITFINSDVLQTAEERKERYSKLQRAMILGNGYKGKVRIIFETTSGSKAVETTIWQATEDNVMLKGGIRIPIKSIREVII